MNSLSLKTNVLQKPLQIAFVLFLIYMAYMALYHGIKGLAYFQNNSNTVTNPVILLAHIGTGFIALVIGPLQFSSVLRKRYLKAHRSVGKIYLVAVLLSGIFGLLMGTYRTFFLDQVVFGTGTMGLALAWLTTAIVAYSYIRKGLVEKHKEWMVRNYVVTFGFVTYRIGAEWMIDHGFSWPETAVMAWLCWVPQLMVVDYFFQLRSKDKRQKAETPITDVLLHR
nr:DUF2306 domain-containing protein [Cytophagales bacterium]